MTLLKNKNNILPLAKSIKVLVAGPSAQSISALMVAGAIHGREIMNNGILLTAKHFPGNNR